MKLAIFDFDGTIYRKETFTLLMQQLKSIYPKRYRHFLTASLPIYAGYKVKIVTEETMKTRLMKRYIAALEGLTEEETKSFFTGVAQEMKDDFNEAVIKRLKSHKASGDYTIILSGAFTPLLHAVDQQLALHCDAMIGTDIPKKGDTFVHVHANQKVSSLQEHVKDNNVDWKASYAYGDSAADIPVLKLVGQPVAVLPDVALEQKRMVNKWEIMV